MIEVNTEFATKLTSILLITFDIKKEEKTENEIQNKNLPIVQAREVFNLRHTYLKKLHLTPMGVKLTPKLNFCVYLLLRMLS